MSIIEWEAMARKLLEESPKIAIKIEENLVRLLADKLKKEVIFFPKDNKDLV